MATTAFKPDNPGCDCCCVCADEWAMFTALYSTLTIAVSFPGATGTFDGSVLLNSGSCGVNYNSVECEALDFGTTGLRYRFAGPSSCALPPVFGGAADIGLWKGTLAVSGSGSCRGVSYPYPPGRRQSAGVACGIGVTCSNGKALWSIGFSMGYPVYGTNGCNPGESYRITDPITQGFTTIRPNYWEKANGSNVSFMDASNLTAFDNWSPVPADYYNSVGEYRDVITSSAAGLPLSITLNPLYNPGGYTASMTIS